MLTTEGTYPFTRGGVSTWCDTLVSRLDRLDFIVYAVMMNPFITQTYRLPPNTSLMRVPLWGTEEPCEHLASRPFSQVYLAKRATTGKVVASRFLPLFETLVTEVTSEEKDPTRFGATCAGLYQVFQEYDYKVCFKSLATWERFKRLALGARGATERPVPTLFDLTQSLGWLYRFLIILNTPLPQVDVSHSAAAAFCGIPGVLSRILHGTPYLLTEHGVYLREQYLSKGRAALPPYLSRFLMSLVRSVVTLNYHYADQVSPVCAYNSRWEAEMGVPGDRIRVIHNGVDPLVFAPSEHSREGPPVVTGVMRIDPVKDIETLLRAAALVQAEVPGVKFIIYGGVTVPAYFDRCLALRARLGLERTFIFAGHVENVPEAYRSGDIVVLSSISEGFPYSIVEAMMAGKAVVATDVGGIREALGPAGIVVPPQDVEQMARAIRYLIGNPLERASLGQEARERALTYFTTEQFTRLYLECYEHLAALQTGKEETVELLRRILARQALFAHRGMALALSGHWAEAIASFRLAISLDESTCAVPVLRIQIAHAFAAAGQTSMALVEMRKAAQARQTLHSRAVSRGAGAGGQDRHSPRARAGARDAGKARVTS